MATRPEHRVASLGSGETILTIPNFRYQRIVLILAFVFQIHHPANGLCSDVYLNEVDYDQVSTDQAEFVELSGNPGTDLSNIELHLVNGLNGDIYRIQTLTGEMPADGYLVIGSVNVPNVDILIGSGGNNLIQNGAPDGVGIWDLETMAYCDFINYEGTVTGFEAWPQIGEDPAGECGTGASESLARRGSSPPPTDNWEAGACSSPGEPNLGPTQVGLVALNARSFSRWWGTAVGILALGALAAWWIYPTAIITKSRS